MRTRPVLPVAAGLAAAAAVVLAAAPAHAAAGPHRTGHVGYARAPETAHRAAADCTSDDGSGPVLVSSSASPTKIAVGISKQQTVSYEAVLTDPCGVHDASLRITYVDGSYDDVPLVHDHDGADGEVWQQTLYLHPQYLLNSDAGTWRMQVVSFDPYGNGTRKKSVTFQPLRYAKISNNASPEPVKKGGTVTVTGKLVRADWQAAAYKAYRYHTVDLQFRTTNGSYETVKTIDSGSTGALKATTRATTSGCYRFVFLGSSTTPITTGAGDCVKVK